MNFLYTFFLKSALIVGLAALFTLAVLKNVPMFF